jgi:hypothetical protein
MIVGGYSAQSSKGAEWYDLTITDTARDGPTEVGPAGKAEAKALGQVEAFSRLTRGISRALPQALAHLGVAQPDFSAYEEAIAAQSTGPDLFPGMPVGDVIDLARFLVDATINFGRFTPGYATVGGPIELAAITKHEGFKWVQRKHYYPASLNC